MKTYNCIYIILVLLLSLNSCGPKPASPESALDAILEIAQNEKPPKELKPLLTERSLELLERYEELREKLYATNLPPEPVELFLKQMRELQPTILDVKDFKENVKAVGVKYANGLGAVFLFTYQDGGWRLNLAEEIESAVAILERFNYRMNALKEAKEEGKPLPEGLFEEDDD